MILPPVQQCGDTMRECVYVLSMWVGVGAGVGARVGVEVKAKHLN